MRGFQRGKPALNEYYQDFSEAAKYIAIEGLSGQLVRSALNTRIENNPAIVYVTVALVSFGVGRCPRGLASVASEPVAASSRLSKYGFIDERIRELSNAHVKRLAELQAVYLEDEKEAANIAHIDSNQETYGRAGEAISRQIEIKNSSLFSKLPQRPDNLRFAPVDALALAMLSAEEPRPNVQRPCRYRHVQCRA